MQELIKLELKKVNLKNQLISLLVCNIIIYFLVITLKFLLPGQVEIIAPDGSPLPTLNMSDMIIIDVLIKAVFIVWCSALLAELIVSEFQKKTALMFYTYPIKISKIILAKLFMISTLIFSFIVVSEIFQNILLYATSSVTNIIKYSFDVTVMPSLLITNISCIFVCLLALYVGLMYKSSIATVVTSIIILCLVTSSAAGPGGLISKVSVSTTLAIVGIVSCQLSLNKIKKEDYV